MVIELPADAKAALGRLALREFRDPQSQAVAIIVSYLEARHLLDGLQTVARRARHRGMDDNP